MRELLRVFRSLRPLYPGSDIIPVAKRICAALYCAPSLPLVSNWLEAEGNPLLAAEFSRHPKIRELIFRPYVSVNWTLKERLHHIATHYLLVKARAPALDLAHRDYIDLAQMEVGDKKLRIVIDKPIWLRREGEVSLSLFLGVDRIYTLMFLLSGTLENMKIIVGNVQGDGRDRLEIYKELTKTLHGMRPRDFLLHILKIVGDELGCTEILGISDTIHRNNHWHSKAAKLAVYDSMWAEHGGIKNSAVFFCLPSRVVKRVETDIPVKKRALYRRRYKLLDDLQLLLRRSLTVNGREQYPNATSVAGQFVTDRAVSSCAL